MRPRLALLALLMAQACKPEQDFDTRYNMGASRINAAAAEIQDELNSQLNAAHQAGLLENNVTAGSPEAHNE